MKESDSIENNREWKLTADKWIDWFIYVVEHFSNGWFIIVTRGNK